ncbi:hypothetical protein D3C81_1840670 [compost metagenome]
MNHRFNHIASLGRERLLGGNQTILLSCNQKARQCRRGQHIRTVWTFAHSQSSTRGSLGRSLVANFFGPGHFILQLLYILLCEQARYKTIDKSSDSLALNRRDCLQPLLLGLLAIRIRRRMKQTKCIQLGSIPLSK